jgi:hypothetical protein
MRKLKKIAGVALVIWLGLVGVVYLLMCQPPERFASAVAKLPGPAFMLIPFETLWFRARAGDLQIGDSAPDFRLNTLDKTALVSLSSFRGSKPVVLVFGSYT